MDSVTHNIPFRFPGGNEGTARFTYAVNDPYAIAVTFKGVLRPWMFSRELFATGIMEGAGEGDIGFRPVGEGVILALRSPDGMSDLLFSHSDLYDFLDETERLVTPGTEDVYFDMAWDREVRELEDKS